jgi:transcriptional regulator with XRE-family HTH domain
MTEKSQTVSDVVARRVRDLRQQWGWSAAELAERCAEWGHPQLTASVIANIESGRRDKHGHRRRDITVDEAFAFARVLQVPVGDLVDPAARMVSSHELIEWLRHQIVVEQDLGDGRAVIRREPVQGAGSASRPRAKGRSDG